MPSTYTSNLGLELMATGEDTNTWGNITNGTWGFVDTAVAGVSTFTLTTTTLTISITNGTSAAGRARVWIFTGNPGGNATITFSPNTAEAWVTVRNNCSGGYTLTFTQGSGTTVTVSNGGSNILYFDGGGSTANCSSLSVGLETAAGGATQQAAAGTAALPGFSFVADATTGAYLPAVGQLGLSAGGTSRLVLSTTAAFSVPVTTTGAITAASASISGTAATGALTVTGTASATGNVSSTLALVAGTSVQAPDGNAAGPSHTFSSETSTGFYRIGSGHMGVSLAGTQVLDLNAAAIGVNGAAQSGDTIYASSTKTQTRLSLFNNNISSGNGQIGVMEVLSSGGAGQCQLGMISSSGGSPSPFLSFNHGTNAIIIGDQIAGNSPRGVFSGFTITSSGSGTNTNTNTSCLVFNTSTNTAYIVVNYLGTQYAFTL